MTKILFVCHGNICRSPMAEFVMKDLVKKAGLTSQFQIASAATSREEIGNPVYPPARRKLAEHGISCAGKTARQLTRADYGAYDLLIGMDQANLRNMRRICGGDPEGKIHLLLEYADRIANLDAFVVDYIRLEELQMYSEDRGIPVYTDVESLAIVKHDLAKDSIRTCLVKGFYMNVDLSVIFDMQSKSIRFNRSRFSTLNTEDIIAAVVAAPQS